MLTGFIGVVGCGLSSANEALAGSPHVSGMRIDWNAWNFKPTYDDASGTARVTGFLALAKEGAASGSNIVAVWYIRNANGTWSTKSWLTSDAAEAIKSVKIGTAIPDSEDEKWEVGQDLHILPTDNPENPKDYGKGLLADDPLYPLLATASDAAALVSLLAEIGYKAAAIKIDNSTGCNSDEQLTVMAGAIEAGLAMTVTDDTSAQAQTQTMATLLAAVTLCAQPTPVCTPGLTGPWVLGAVVGPKACSWAVTSTWTALNGGRSYTCNYSYCCTYARTRSAPAIRADCATYTCTQLKIQRVCSSPGVSCTVFAANPSPPAVWVPPCGTSPACSTVPPVIPAVPTLWLWPGSTNCP